VPLVVLGVVSNAVTNMFGLSFGFLMGLLAVREMVMAVWLIVKGFEPAERRSPSNPTFKSPAQSADL
jgi:hypothetical protein